MKEAKVRRIHRVSMCSLGCARQRFVLRTPSSHVSIPRNQKGTLAKDGFCESGKCIGKLQACKRGVVRVQPGRAVVSLHVAA